jgi:hypothetical protein
VKQLAVIELEVEVGKVLELGSHWGWGFDFDLIRLDLYLVDHVHGRLLHVVLVVDRVIGLCH